MLPIHPVFLEKNSITENTDNIIASAAANDNGKASRRKNKEEIRNLIIDALESGGNQSMNELASALGYAKLTNTVRNVINEMLEAGDVTYLYPDMPKNRNQKICLNTPASSLRGLRPISSPEQIPLD